MKMLQGLFARKQPAEPTKAEGLAGLLSGYSIEVLPKTVGKLVEHRAALRPGSRVYIAHIQGTSIADMVDTARKVLDAGFDPMPHFPARLIRDRQTLAEWIARYREEAGVHQALLIAGGLDRPQGHFSSSMEMMQTGLFDKAGFDRLHIAGHPEGNRDIDPDGSDRNTLSALRWKQDFAKRTGVEMAIVTQFSFDSAPVVVWAERLVQEGIELPIHLGAPGPAKLQTLLRFALHCGVGPSIRVLHRRAADVTRMMLPFTPEEFLRGIALHKTEHPASNIEGIHFFPLGGIEKVFEWCGQFAAGTPHPENDP
jgi:methylenetetrahydrofolate reductase (NADPH)